MRSYVIFDVLGRLYGIDIECVKRILPAQFLTATPDEEVQVEGMFKYEDEVIKVLSFRKVIGERSYDEELLELFPKFRTQLKEWMDALIDCLENARPFSKSTDPHASELGKWIDSFHPEHEDVVKVIKKLDLYNQDIHRSAIDVLEHCSNDIESSKNILEDTIKNDYTGMLEQFKKLENLSNLVAATLQRCLVLVDKDEKLFGINIDAVDDIVHVEENGLHEVKDVQTMGEFMNVAAILEHNNKLVTIVKDIRMNKRSK